MADHARQAGRGADESAGALGKLGLAGGLGFMLGPSLGGFLVKDYRQAAAVSLTIQLIALVLLQLLPGEMGGGGWGVWGVLACRTPDS